MDVPESGNKTVKEKLRGELFQYGLNVAYLTIVFAAFTAYRTLILAAHNIVYTNYLVAVIEGLILGKVIMIGSLFRLGRRFETKPLIYPTLYKTVVFTVFVGTFKVIEHGVKGLLKGQGFMGGVHEFSEKGFEELMANGLVVFVAFMPFFAIKELGRLLGEGRIAALFFRSSALENDASSRTSRSGARTS
jgi:hypothetical protein